MLRSDDGIALSELPASTGLRWPARALRLLRYRYRIAGALPRLPSTFAGIKSLRCRRLLLPERAWVDLEKACGVCASRLMAPVRCTNKKPAMSRFFYLGCRVFRARFTALISLMMTPSLKRVVRVSPVFTCLTCLSTAPSSVVETL